MEKVSFSTQDANSIAAQLETRNSSEGGVMNNPTEKSSLESQAQTVPGAPTHEEIELRAYQIYVERGGTHGQDVDDWLQAERELVEKYSQPVPKARAATV